MATAVTPIATVSLPYPVTTQEAYLAAILEELRTLRSLLTPASTTREKASTPAEQMQLIEKYFPHSLYRAAAAPRQPRKK